MQQVNLVKKIEAIQEMGSTEIDAVGGGTFAAYGAIIAVAVGIYKAGESVGSGMGHAIYNLRHK